MLTLSLLINLYTPIINHHRLLINQTTQACSLCKIQPLPEKPISPFSPNMIQWRNSDIWLSPPYCCPTLHTRLNSPHHPLVQIKIAITIWPTRRARDEPIWVNPPAPGIPPIRLAHQSSSRLFYFSFFFTKWRTSTNTKCTHCSLTLSHDAVLRVRSLT